MAVKQGCRIIRPVSEFPFQGGHDRQYYIFPPVARDNLDADRQSRAASFHANCASFYRIVACLPIALLPTSDARDGHHSCGHPEQIVKQRIAPRCGSIEGAMGQGR